MDNTNTIQIPEFIKTTFGTDTDIIIKTKSNGTQQREAVNKTVPIAKVMTADVCKALCEKTGVVYKDGYEERVLSYTCSDESVDRYGDIIRQNGWQLDNYLKNPVVMAFHDYGKMPVGSALDVRVEGKTLKMDILFPDADVNEDADKIFKMAKAGFMRAGSVGFIPLKINDIGTAEKIKLGMTPYGVEYISQELLEHTVCGVPANANAVQDMVSKGLFTKKDLIKYVKKDILDTITENESDPVTPQDTTIEVTEDTTIIVVEPTIEVKAGAVLSAKNKVLIQNVLDNLAVTSIALQELLASADTTPDISIPDNMDEEDKGLEQALKTLTLDTSPQIDTGDDESDEDEGLYAEIHNNINKLLTLKKDN